MKGLIYEWRVPTGQYISALHPDPIVSFSRNFRTLSEVHTRYIVHDSGTSLWEVKFVTFEVVIFKVIIEMIII